MAVRREPVEAFDRPGRREGPDLIVALDRGVKTALHEQLEIQLRELVRSGRLPPGTRLPSSRALARKLDLSRGVVLEAYSQLAAEGYLTASQGAPTRVALTPSAERPPIPATSLEPPRELDLDPGLPDLAGFPREQWLRSLRAAVRETPFGGLGHQDPRGAPRLRNELLGYLGRVRGAAPEPEHTLVCAGFTEAFSILCRVLSDRGVERIALEDPGWSRARMIAERAGLAPVGIPVDEMGIDVPELAASGCEVVCVTPAHQFPTGVVLASERRGALMEWAEDHDGLIVEDDYDSELRFDRVPVGALQGLAPERVCHIGSVSKRLAPGLRLGWMLSPSWLTGDLSYDKALTSPGASFLDQITLADFIARGELDRHLRRMRLRYRQRREALIEALEHALPGLDITGVPAGVWVTAMLPEGSDEQALLRAAGASGAAAEGLAPHRLGPEGPPGLLLGYANLAEPAIARAVRAFAGEHMP
jgi:GntR family transcriptional regulator / MocR family aminotransferase